MFKVEKRYLSVVLDDVKTLETKTEAQAAVKSGERVVKVYGLSFQLGLFAIDVDISFVVK